jgi:asparagine synthase (glutamine-hydrolysing)
MCGIAGYIDLRRERRVNQEVLSAMAETIVHRGPDSSGFFVEEDVGLALQRLSIIDLAGGDQPIYNEDRSVVVVCNGEIFNYRELRHDLGQRGHRFSTCGDVEVLVHLYEDQGTGFLAGLNAQFAFAIYDRAERKLLLARDHFGINPLYFGIFDGFLIFASEIKSMLRHPAVRREVDLTGLDQVFSFPGLVSPRTMFKGIWSLKSGHSLTVEDGRVEVREYWDLKYPRLGEEPEEKPEAYYVERLRELLLDSVRYRLQADVPVGFYLSGGLDSSLIAAAIHAVSPGLDRRSFSIDFTERSMSEAACQDLVARHVGSTHQRIVFDWRETAQRLSRMIYHAECPVKETYNTCTLALSEAARGAGVPVVLTGEGADELFAGYVGYRFDRFRRRGEKRYDLETIMEDEIRERIWGSSEIFYEIDHHAFGEIKAALYSAGVNEVLPEFDCLNHELVNKERLRDRHPVHWRSYLDFRLRLSDHLLTDHGDRMALANSVEGRHPFLDLKLVDFCREIPPHLKVNDLYEKYILRKVATGLVPESIVSREKFGWYSSGSAELLQRKEEWVLDLLSYERIRRQGYFNPDVIERLKRQYSRPGFKLNFPFESDLLMIVLTFGMFLDIFELPAFGA